MSPLSNIDENHELYPVLKQVYDDMERIEEKVSIYVEHKRYPDNSEGKIWDIRSTTVDGVRYLLMKTFGGWKKITLVDI